jgi:hypothetical protein
MMGLIKEGCLVRNPSWPGCSPVSACSDRGSVEEVEKARKKGDSEISQKGESLEDALCPARRNFM